MVLLSKELLNIWSIAVAVILVTLVGMFMTGYGIALENIVNKKLDFVVRVIINYHYVKISHIYRFFERDEKCHSLTLFSKAFTSDEHNLYAALNMIFLLSLLFISPFRISLSPPEMSKSLLI